ncbi:MAG: type II CRISPR RNA-guided endonuclease Cas9 [Nitrospiria bacterium]
MVKRILGLDLGTNSIGWALLEAGEGQPNKIVDLGSRIFIKAVEEKTPTPKNKKRRDARLARRVIQRRAKRKARMLEYLIQLGLLPSELKDHPQPEIILNTLGNPCQLRKKGLDTPLEKYELGRVFLHLVQRRGFLSNRKTLLDREMLDDPDVQEELSKLEGLEDNSSERTKEETAFKKNISALRGKIKNSGCRTLGEYLASRGHHECKRNRSREGGYLRTDRQMYRDELDLIWKKQAKHHVFLSDNVLEEIERMIFYQRPLKLKSNRIGKCSLEPSRKRANMGRLEAQRFRYLQDINSIRFFDPEDEEIRPFSQEQRMELIDFFERESSPTFAKIKNRLKLHKKTEFNLENGTKKLKGNITACEIRAVVPQWDRWEKEKQHALVEDLLTIKKKSVLKKRLVTHWSFDAETAVRLCLLEFEAEHANLSVKAMNRLLPFLEEGQIYSDARISAGYGYEIKAEDVKDRLGPSPDLPNPIVKRALSELRRVINALIAEYGKPDAVRIEMARDLEMNTKRYQAFLKQQKENTQANEEAVQAYQLMIETNPHLGLSKYPDKGDKIRYRLWKDQQERCAYSGRTIGLTALFSTEIDVDHILPYSLSLDDSYMNKVVCYAAENRNKGQRTPIDAFGGNAEKWNQITQAVNRWDKKLRAKKDRFFMTSAELQDRDFIETQLNDTRYICREAKEYVKQLGADVNVSKGSVTAWLRHQWGLNTLIGETNEKERTDHRHHAIDAVVIACVDRRFYQALVRRAKAAENMNPGFTLKNLKVDLPWHGLRSELQQCLNDMIVAHTPIRKLTGALHEETGIGFIEGIGTVKRVDLNGDFKPKQVEKIVDNDVRDIVRKHLERYNNKPKEAFSENVTVYHKDGRTPIKRVRIRQSETAKAKLEKSKLGVKDKQGKIFKWMAYGNMHHVEIIRHKETGKYTGVFVTMMEASRRAKGIHGKKEPIIRTDHGKANEFFMALHINDMVSVGKEGQRVFYRVQKLDSANKRVNLRLHTASTLKKVDETLKDKDSTIPALIKSGLKLHKINSIGKLME